MMKINVKFSDWFVILYIMITSTAGLLGIMLFIPPYASPVFTGFLAGLMFFIYFCALIVIFSGYNNFMGEK